MQKRKFLHAAVLVLLPISCVTRANAYDKDEDPPLEYAYNHTIDLQIGSGRNLTSYSELPDQGIGVFGHDSWGFDLDLRYTRFFSRHWGAYFQFGILSLGTHYDDMVEPLTHHYNHGGKEVRIDDEWYCGLISSDCGSFYDRYLLGATYRYDVGRWSFRPRLGLGIMRQYDSHSHFYVVDNNTHADYEHVDLYSTNSRGETKTVPAFAYSPSLQICFSTCSHVFISAEVEWTGTIRHLYQRTIAKQYHTSELNDWQPNEFEYFLLFGDREFVKKTDDHLTRVHMGNFLQLRIGIGWNIGWNRNEGHRKSK